MCAGDFHTIMLRMILVPHITCRGIYIYMSVCACARTCGIQLIVHFFNFLVKKINEMMP